MQAGLLIMSSPLASGFYALSSNHQRKGSEDIGPEEVIHSDANHGLPNHGSLPVSQHIESPKPSRQPEEDQSTHSGPEDAASSTNEIVKPSPAYKAYTAADRKSTNASLQDSTTASPFLIPLYDRPSLTKRISTNIGPYDFGTTSSPFSRLSYGSSMFNRRSRILAPDGNPAAQQVFPARKASDEEDPANIGLDERTPNRTTAIRRSLGPGDWDSSSVSPGAADPTASDEVRKSIPNDYAAGGAINTAKPFFASTNPFAKKPDTSKATSGTEQLPTRTASMSYGKRTSRNFSKKLPNITVPENKTSISGPTPTLPSAAMADTSMQTPTRASFASVHEQKRPRLSSAAFTGLTPLSEKEVQFDQSTFGNSTPVSSRQPSTIGTSRRTSMIGPPSAMDNRRPSLAGSRRSSISVTNVVIPAHLMTHVETNWNEDNVIGRRKSTYRREDSRSSFNIQSMAQQQQEEVKNIIKMTPQAPDHMSTSMEALAQADPFAAMRERQTSARMSRGKSLAAVSEAIDPNEEESEKPLTPNEPPEGLTPWGQFAFRYRDADVSPGAAIDPADPMAAVGAALGLVATNNTNNSNPTARRPSMWRRIATADVNGPYNGERRGTVFQRANSVFQDTLLNVRKKVRRSSMWDVYENAKKRQLAIRRKRWVQITFEYSFYAMLLVLLYFLIIGVPLWKGTYWELYLAFKYKLNVTGSWSVIIAVSVAYAYSPLLVLFEPDPPMPDEPIDATKTPNVSDTALMIPCYKAANLIGPTLEAATKIFPPSHIFVVANGNSPTPLDNTEEICRPFGVNHIWSPVGSKIVAQFVGCYAAKDFKNVLLIDDDCALPPNFPIVSDRLKGSVMCMGYTIKSVGPNSSKGTLCQQAQDLEYKISGIQRALAGKIGSATFPHGAISLWDRQFLIKTFSKHPGFSVSEDWFFGHVARQLGCRTQMATSVFIETETPDAVFFSSGGERGGFGEMTVFKQRFYRWNFFFVNGMYYNLHYILFSWKLGWWELGAKLFVFQEIYETLLYLATPIVVPVSLA
ncbi:glycosyltransferase family 2 protein, partial [Aureobasidium melanogenum]